MGYQTDFILTTDEYLDEEIVKKIGDRLDEISTYRFEESDGDFYLYNAKWYDSHEDMLELSKEFPEYVFQLDGNGEGNDDVWRQYYKDGKSQNANARVIYDDFDESRLK